MKKLISFVLVLSLVANIATADTNCDWSTIKKLPDGGYEYSPQLNLCVGALVQSNQVQLAQIDDLTKALSLKDLALQNSDARVALWQKSSNDELDRLNKLDSTAKTNEWVFFSLGVATTFLAGYMAAKLVNR